MKRMILVSNTSGTVQKSWNGAGACFIFLAVVFAVIGPNTIAQEVEPDTPNEPASVAENKEVQPEFKPAPETTGEDCNGDTFSLGDYQGKVVLLYFWGDWCPPCRALNPMLNEMVTSNEDRPFVVLGVNADQDPATVRRLVNEEKILWRSFQDVDQKIAEAWNVQAYPTLILIDASGNIVETKSSLRDSKLIGKEIDSLVLPLMDLGEEELEALKDAAADKRDRK